MHSCTKSPALRGSSAVWARRPRHPKDTATLVSWHSARHKEPRMDFSPGLYPCGSRGDARPQPPFMGAPLSEATSCKPDEQRRVSVTRRKAVSPHPPRGSVPQAWLPEAPTAQPDSGLSAEWARPARNPKSHGDAVAHPLTAQSSAALPDRSTWNTSKYDRECLRLLRQAWIMSAC